MESDPATTVLTVAFVMAMVFGVVATRTNFCTMGAVSDWVNMGDTGRFRAWLLALAVALLGSLGLEALSIIDLGDSRIPYRSASFAWPRYLLGGILFGIGMTLAGGCANKNLVRLGGGNTKSLVVLIIMGAMAYLMTRTNFYGIVFLTWMAPLTPDLSTQIGASAQDAGAVAGALLGADDPGSLRLGIGVVVALILAGYAFASADFRRSADNVAGGLIVGALVTGAWYLTGGPLGQEWIEAAAFSDRPPEGVGMQSFTFVNPAADTLAWLMEGGDKAYVTFGVMVLCGVIVGSAVYSLAARRFRFEWFMSVGDFLRHAIGAVLMGIGGVLALGCTIGQGVSGLSTLAIGSAMAVISIILSSALTMKIQYYRMLHEEASFIDALLTGLADLKLLPASMRRLEDL